MTENKRIALNALASYGRSLFAMGMGLFSARWVLSALGKSDYGLFGLVGSIIMFVGLLNGIMSAAVSRYYAFAIGEAKTMGEVEGREHLIRWFNAAFSIHAFLPTILAVIGYPIGVYAIHHWLVIPPERVAVCVIVFRMVLLSAFVGMMAVPYTAFYGAKQLIAELSLCGVIQTTISFACAFFLLSWEGDRLVAYSTYMTLVPVSVTSFLIWRAKRHFGVCEIRRAYLFSWDHLKKLFVFASGELFGWLGGATRDQGMAFLINVNYGLGMNASYSVAQQVSNHTTSLSSAMIGAFVPALSTAEGSGDHERAKRLAYTSIKFGTILVALFAIPLIIEIKEVLRLWLKTPPEHVDMFATCVLVALMIHKLGWGFHLSILVKGRIVAYQITAGIIGAGGVLIAWMLIHAGLGVLGVGLSFIINFAILDIVRACFARRLCGMAVRYWVTHIVLPVALGLAIVFSTGYGFSSLLPQSFFRVCGTSAICSLILLAVTWYVICDREERQFLVAGFEKIRNKLFRKRVVNG